MAIDRKRAFSKRKKRKLSKELKRKPIHSRGEIHGHMINPYC